MLATTTHPDIASTILCAAFGLYVLKVLLKAMFGGYENNRAPMRVKRGRPE